MRLLIKNTFDAIYDRNKDSYHPKDRLSTIRPTSAPKSDFSSSDEDTPSFNGINLFSFVIAIWMGMRQRQLTSHSPARKCDTFQSLSGASLAATESNVMAETRMSLSSSPVGFLVAFSNVWIMFEKYDAKDRWLRSVTKTRALGCLLLESEMVWRRTAGKTGKRVQTSAWQSIRELCTVESADPREKPFAPFSLNINSVTLRVISRIMDRHWWRSTSRPIKWTDFLLKEVSTEVSAAGRSRAPSAIPEVEPKVPQW